MAVPAGYGKVTVGLPFNGLKTTAKALPKNKPLPYFPPTPAILEQQASIGSKDINITGAIITIEGGNIKTPITKRVDKNFNFIIPYGERYSITAQALNGETVINGWKLAKIFDVNQPFTPVTITWVSTVAARIAQKTKNIPINNIESLIQEEVKDKGIHPTRLDTVKIAEGLTNSPTTKIHDTAITSKEIEIKNIVCPPDYTLIATSNDPASVPTVHKVNEAESVNEIIMKINNVSLEEDNIKWGTKLTILDENGVEVLSTDLINSGGNLIPPPSINISLRICERLQAPINDKRLLVEEIQLAVKLVEKEKVDLRSNWCEIIMKPAVELCKTCAK